MSDVSARVLGQGGKKIGARSAAAGGGVKPRDTLVRIGGGITDTVRWRQRGVKA